MVDKGQHWTQPEFLSVHPSFYPGNQQSEVVSSKESSVSFLQQASLALVTLFLPDINTTAAPVVLSTQREVPAILSPLFG